MEVLRTPAERFAGLPGYPFEPHYVEAPDGEGGSLRIHYADEGPPDADPVLLLHGEPSWSYLYRKMISVLTVAGHRAVAADLVGFGRSDKPARRQDYTYQRHVDWMRALIEGLNLRNITLVGQDWGGLIGPLRPHRRRQHVPSHRRPARRGGVPALATLLPGDAGVPRRWDRQGRLRDGPVPRSDCRLRRPLPGRPL